MHTRSKLLLAGLAATLLLAAGVQTASANRLSLGETRFTWTWSSFEQHVLEVTIRCPLTLTGSFHGSTLAKTVGLLLGVVTSARVNAEACTGGSATVLMFDLPWHVKYRSFQGRLPAVTSLKFDVIDVSMRFATSSGIIPDCLWRTTAIEPLGITAVVSSGSIVTIQADPTAGIDPIGFLPVCEFIDVQWSGIARASPAATLSLI